MEQHDKQYTKQHTQQKITNSTCIVTGGAGFIGSHITDTLATPALQNHIIIIDNLSTGKLANIAHHFNNVDREAFEQVALEQKPVEQWHTSNISKDSVRITDKQQSLDNAQANKSKNKEEQKEEFVLPGDHVTFIKADIRDLALLQNIFKKHKPEYVFHLAAIASVPKSIEDPLTTHEVNVTGTLNVLLAAKETETVKKFVFSSSCAIYGNPKEDELPIKETQSANPQSPYATSKLMGEQYCSIFSKTYNLPTVALRYFNVYGPRQDPNGEYAAVIPKFINLVLNDKPPIIYGDGEQTRDFTFINDVVNANSLAMEGEETGVFNAADGKQISINELAKIVTEKIGKDLQPVYNDLRPGDIKHSFADISKAKEHFGYEDYFDIKKGLKKTIEWFGIDLD